jgi:hypothetical protein
LTKSDLVNLVSKKEFPLLAILNRATKRAVILTLATSFVALIVVFVKKNPVTLGYRGPNDSPPNGLKVKLTSATFQVGDRHSFNIQAIGDFDPVCKTIDAKISEQGWEKSFTRSELVNGVQAEWTPTRPGVYRMQFFCGNRSLGDTSVSVVAKSVSTSLKPRKVQWLLAPGKPIYRDNSFFEIPVVVSCQAQSGASFVPNPVDHDVYLRILDRNGQVSNISLLRIQQNTAISDPVYLPFPIGADYRLTAYETGSGQASNEVQLSWREMAPSLSLIAFPDNVELYSAGLSSSALQLYLAVDSRQIKPAEATPILLAAPSVFKSEPPDKLTLSPSNPIGIYRLNAPTQTGDWRVSFQEPRLGLNTIAAVKVLSTFKFTLTAMVAGLLGVLVARGGDLFSQPVLRIIVEIVSAVGAAFLLYALLLTGWINTLRTPEFIINYFGAAAIGLVGGYVGLGIFQLAKRVIVGESK